MILIILLYNIFDNLSKDNVKGRRNLQNLHKRLTKMKNFSIIKESRLIKIVPYFLQTSHGEKQWLK